MREYGLYGVCVMRESTVAMSSVVWPFGSVSQGGGLFGTYGRGLGVA